MRLLITLALMLSLGCASSFGQARQPELPAKFAEYTGAELDVVWRAWQRLHTHYEPNASISDFSVTYSRRANLPPTIGFYAPPAMSNDVHGQFVSNQEGRFYQVIVDGTEVRVLVGTAGEGR